MIILAAALIFAVTYWVMATGDGTQTETRKIRVRSERPIDRHRNDRVIDE